MIVTDELLFELIDSAKSFTYKSDIRESILKQLLLKAKTDGLTELEYVFIIKSFCNRVLSYMNILLKDDKDYSYLLNLHSEHILPIEDIIEYYYELHKSNPGKEKGMRDFKEIAETVVKYYRIATEWMIKKGYEV